MKLRVAVIAVVSAFAMVPAYATGGGVGPKNPDFGGKLDGKKNRYFGFDVVRNNGKRRVFPNIVRNAPFDCPGTADDGTESGFLEKSFRVRPDKTFGGTRRYDFGKARGVDATGLKYTLEGEFTSGRRAKGTLQITTFLEAGGSCRTPVMNWRARKPAPDPPGGVIIGP